jgi:alanine racemase
MQSVVTLQARILQIHNVKVGETVGYGADFLVERPSRIATLAIGYADGISRLLSNKGHAFIAGQTVPFAGRVSMDLMTVDITDIPADNVKIGMFAELIGPNLSLDAMAAEAETIGYEILTGLGRRSSRIYLMSDRYESAQQ